MITQQQALEALEALKHAEPDGWGPVQNFTTLRQYIEQSGQATKEAGEDAELLNWLETQVVDVRSVLRYGSRRVFIYKPPFNEEGEPDGGKTLRETLRAAIAAERKA